MKVRFIGDVHQLYGGLDKVIKESDADVCVCVGDLGLDYKWIEENVSVNCFRFVPGNHDNYNQLPEHSLGDFGTWNGIFYIRGAHSIDKEFRIPGLDWWEKEELSYEQGKECIEFYSEIKPEIVISHDCPNIVVPLLFPFAIKETSRTRQILDACFEFHQPKTWIFGHWHKSISSQIHGTWFHCLDELCYFDLEVQ